jgi:hypothetical protein
MKLSQSLRTTACHLDLLTKGVASNTPVPCLQGKHGFSNVGGAFNYRVEAVLGLLQQFNDVLESRHEPNADGSGCTCHC